MRYLVMAMIALVAFAGLQPVASAVEEGQWFNLFDGESTYGWTAFGDVPWSVSDGVLTGTDGYSGWLASTCQFKDFELVAEVRASAGAAMGLIVRGGLEGHPSENGSGMFLVEGKRGDDWREVRVVAVGNDLQATIDGKKVDLSATRHRGHVGICYQRSHGQREAPVVAVKSVKLRPLGLDPLFNGKDLTGWNILPDHASKFNVVDGAINITDGNGQIETAGTYRDFILQLDIISNGEHLNSGVFFRGPVGVFWRGYESQVRNQWEGDDRTQPVDYGTGGVYGLRPARKVVSSDGEWFSKTIVCDGNHYAVWINGYLVSDFYDMRPPTDNGDGKGAYVPQPGTIHLQGHDKTTDLSFKNINIQEY